MRRMGCPRSLGCQFEAMSVTDVADGERWTHRSIVCSVRLSEKILVMDVVMFSCSKERLGVSSFYF